MSNQIKWIVEDAFEEDTERLIQSLQKFDTEYYKLTKNPCLDKSWKSLANREDCVITHGSIQFGNIVQRETSWIPGHYCNNNAYKCSVYYPKFGGDLLNYNYIMLPFEELPNKIDFIYDKIGIEDAVFVRPDSGMKSFTGRMIYKENFDKDYNFLSVYDPDPSSICLICEPRNIEKEWRFFVSEGKIITGSEYKPNKIVITKDDYIWGIAQGFVHNAQYQPDFIWCIDLCKTSIGNYYVLEIGLFSSAGLYCCNTDLIVPVVNKLALAEWNDIFNA